MCLERAVHFLYRFLSFLLFFLFLFYLILLLLFQSLFLSSLLFLLFFSISFCFPFALSLPIFPSLFLSLRAFFLLFSKENFCTFYFRDVRNYTTICNQLYLYWNKERFFFLFFIVMNLCILMYVTFLYIPWLSCRLTK